MTGPVVRIDGKTYQLDRLGFGLRLEWSRVGGWSLWDYGNNALNDNPVQVGNEFDSQEFIILQTG